VTIISYEFFLTYLIKNFNLAFEETLRTQKTYAIPDSELRHAIIKDIKNVLLPMYSRFVEKYVITLCSCPTLFVICLTVSITIDIKQPILPRTHPNIFAGTRISLTECLISSLNQPLDDLYWEKDLLIVIRGENKHYNIA
jgi:Exo70 exocyst complex subunit